MAEGTGASEAGDVGGTGRVFWRLSGMMALIYMVQGAWWPLLAVHLKDLGISGRGRGWMFATLAVASLATPLGAGQLADRLMSTQRLMALLYAMGTGLLVLMALGLASQVGPMFLLFLAFWLLVAPTYGLSNSLALRNLPRPREQFGRVRLWGTIGWMAVGWAVSAVMAWSGSTRAGQGAYEAFWVAAVVSAVLAVYSLTLPDTPPLAGNGRSIHLLEALSLARQPAVAVYLITAFGVSLTLPNIYQVVPAYLEAKGLPRPWTASALTLGQVLEVAALAGMPWLLRRLGFGGTLMLGIGAWALRYGSLLVDPPLWVAVGGVLLQGVGIACFTVGGQVFLDAQAPPDRRASAQALNTVVTSGLGALLGSLLTGEIASALPGGSSWVFLVPFVLSVGLLLFFVRGFHPRAGSADRLPERWSDRMAPRDMAATAASEG